MSNVVEKWYEDKNNVDEMLNWNSELKDWEKSVIKHFPSGARILDIGCGLGREAFALSDLGFNVIGPRACQPQPHRGGTRHCSPWRRR